MSTNATTTEPRQIWFLATLVKIHISADDTGGRFSMLESWAPEGDRPPLHVHDEDDEGFYLLEGKLTLWVGADRIELEPGQFVLAPHGVPHTFRVESEGGARWLVTSSDASFDRFVAAYGVPAEEDRLPAPAEPDVERLTTLAAEHGIEILGPPGMLPSEL